MNSAIGMQNSLESILNVFKSIIRSNNLVRLENCVLTIFVKLEYTCNNLEQCFI